MRTLKFLCFSHQAHLPLSDQSWPHSLLPAALSARLGPREQLLNLPVDCLFPQPFPGLATGCHSPAGVSHPAKVPLLQAESDTTERLNRTELKFGFILLDAYLLSENCIRGVSLVVQ